MTLIEEPERHDKTKENELRKRNEAFEQGWNGLLPQLSKIVDEMFHDFQHGTVAGAINDLGSDKFDTNINGLLEYCDQVNTISNLLSHPAFVRKTRSSEGANSTVFRGDEAIPLLIFHTIISERAKFIPHIGFEIPFSEMEKSFIARQVDPSHILELKDLVPYIQIIETRKGKIIRVSGMNIRRMEIILATKVENASVEFKILFYILVYYTTTPAGGDNILTKAANLLMELLILSSLLLHLGTNIDRLGTNLLPLGFIKKTVLPQILELLENHGISKDLLVRTPEELLTTVDGITLDAGGFLIYDTQKLTPFARVQINILQRILNPAPAPIPAPTPAPIDT